MSVSIYPSCSPGDKVYGFLAFILSSQLPIWHNAGMDTPKDQQRKITIQLPQWLIDAMKAQAEAHRRSFTGEIVWALQWYVRRQEGDQEGRHR
jgi:hypothetical protein